MKRYFLLKEHKDMTDRPQLMNWMNVIDERNLSWGNYHLIEDISTIFVKPDDFVYYADVIMKPFFMFQKNYKDIMSLYEPNMDYRQLVLIDTERNKAIQYFLPHLWEVDCLSNDSVYNLDHSELTKIVLLRSKLKDKEIFQIANVTNRYVVVSLQMLESILRRGAFIDYEELEIIEDIG